MPTHKPNDPKGAAGAVKTPLGLIPPSAMEEIAWVHKLGADKYGPFNWRMTGVCASTYVHAILRHLNAWRNGDDIDPESGRSHIAHVACCCNILLDAAACGTLDDDRDKMPEHVEATFNKFVDDEPESCECGRYKVNHFQYGLICEDCELHPEY